jgi:hypothetical protein
MNNSYELMVRQSKGSPADVSFQNLFKLADLSEVDRKTLDLRGASGGFRPEGPEERATCLEAQKQGASKVIEFWRIEDYDRGIKFRETWAMLDGSSTSRLANSITSTLSGPSAKESKPSASPM